MIVKIIEAPCVPGKRAISLCDDDGKVLPMITRAVIENGVDETPKITVTFLIDGETIWFAD